jgi:hypothetical protein
LLQAAVTLFEALAERFPGAIEDAAAAIPTSAKRYISRALRVRVSLLINSEFLGAIEDAAASLPKSAGRQISRALAREPTTHPLDAMPRVVLRTVLFRGPDNVPVNVPNRRQAC